MPDLTAARATTALVAAMSAIHGLDPHQGRAVYRQTRTKARVPQNNPTLRRWGAFLDQQIYALALADEIPLDVYERLDARLQAARTTPPDRHTYAALRDLPDRAEKAQAALRRQITTTAALRGVDVSTVSERFTAYRRQYQRFLRALPEQQQPTPPEHWLTGYCTRDLLSMSCPTDPATLYAMYRCQADPAAFPVTPGLRYASIDLETAGPDDPSGLLPHNGSIIEVGIAEYDITGTRIDTYSQLVRPAPEVAAVCGTGAIAVHGITLDDVRDAPAWSEIAAQVAARLHGRTLLAQNARFETTWLTHHLGLHGIQVIGDLPVLDTLPLARQHLPHLADHRLDTICGALDVPYTDGHRALHDAEAAARAFFALRQRIHTTWTASPQHRVLAQPPAHVGNLGQPLPRVWRGTDPLACLIRDDWALDAA